MITLTQPRTVCVEPFDQTWAGRWDDFILRARNGHFMLTRRYLEYHGDRFDDASLLLLNEGKLLAVMPAHRDGSRLISHLGLPFAGLITHRKMRMRCVLEAFDAICSWMQSQSLHSLEYKAVPYIYHRLPAEEDLFALRQLGAFCLETKVTAAVRMDGSRPYNQKTRRAGAKAVRAGVETRNWENYHAYYTLHAQMLAERHHAVPLHSRAEFLDLVARFPRNIRLLGAFRGTELLAGVLLFVDEAVIRIQGSGATFVGRELGAEKYLKTCLLQNQEYRGKWVDLGTSMEPESGQLADSLFSHKEALGGRAVMISSYRLDI